LTDDLTAGAVIGSWGTHGEFKVKLFVEPKNFFNFSKCVLRGVEYDILGSRIHREYLLLKLNGIDTPEEIANYKGELIIVDRNLLPPTEADEVYWFEIKGFDVVDSDGIYVGRLADYIETGEVDVFCISDPQGREFLISNNKEHVLKIDTYARMVTVARLGLIGSD
jgi:16S rRNA processing protein RimM